MLARFGFIVGLFFSAVAAVVIVARPESQIPEQAVMMIVAPPLAGWLTGRLVALCFAFIVGGVDFLRPEERPRRRQPTKH